MLPDADAASRLDQLLDYLTNTLKSGVDFAGTQIPLLARDIALYGAYSNWILFSSHTLCAFICAYLCKRSYRIAVAPTTKSDATVGHTFITIFAVIGTITFTVTSFPRLDDAVKATFAPRVYILEYVADLIKPTARTR
jgi:hypothetical protein